MPAMMGVVLCGVVVYGPSANPAWAQTRAEEIAAAQAEKARHLAPYEPSRVEEILLAITRSRLDPPRVSPLFGSVYAGGSVTPGVLYRRFYGDRSLFHALGFYSVKNYKLVQAGTVVPSLGRDRLQIAVDAGWRDATQVGFYGLGSATDPDARANYRFQQTFVQGRAEYRPRRWLPIAGGVGYERYDLLRGQGTAPSIETVYTAVTAPGLGASPRFVRSDAGVAIDTRPAAGYARRGGAYAIAYTNYADTGGGTFSFDRLDGEVIQHVPVLRETWIVSVRARVQTTIGDDVVPYFLMPALGGGSSLRGYSSWRFRDRHSLLTNAEWRWTPNRLALDLAIFYDAGMVAPRREDLNVRHMATNWGVGSRIHVPDLTVLRIEVARGGEGWQIVFSSKAIF